MSFSFSVKKTELNGDLHTPVSIYLKVRDLFPQSALLESTDSNAAQNSKSFIALDPIASVSVSGGVAMLKLPDGSTQKKEIGNDIDAAMSSFMSLFSIDGDYGVFGFTAYDSVSYLENIAVHQQRPNENDAPDLCYILYRYTIVANHHNDTLEVRELVANGEESQAEMIRSAINSRNFSSYPFIQNGDVYSTMSDEQYIENVKQGIAHCKRGDVFQVVLSRRFVQPFKGDDFAVYRSLRRINPSPYLFYFDFGGFRIFGSSPETHCKIENGRISIDPIAGTAFRTGDLDEDNRRAAALEADPKENAEHVMLVDLARNDLSRNAEKVGLEFYKQTQYYSHVIHLVSRVSGELDKNASPFKAYLDTFPAGTLSGAPKVRAMQIINDLEPHNRGIYGGAIGYVGFDGSLNQAITIRTFVSRNGNLEFQAGAGIVALSNPERELEEVKSKLGALSNAIIKSAKGGE